MRFRPYVTVHSARFGDVPLPEPGYDGLNNNSATFVDGARNIEGNFIGTVTGDDKEKIEITWLFLTPRQWSDILRLFSHRLGGSFVNRVTFFSQETGGWMTRTMYVSDRNANVFLRDDRGDVRSYRDCRLSLVEV